MDDHSAAVGLDRLAGRIRPNLPRREPAGLVLIRGYFLSDQRLTQNCYDRNGDEYSHGVTLPKTVILSIRNVQAILPAGALVFKTGKSMPGAIARPLSCAGLPLRGAGPVRL